MTTRALELFDALCDASEEEQARTLTGESEPVRQRVEAMLRADADPGSDTPDPMLIAESMAVDLADDFTATTPCGISVPDELPGFELLGELGQGGMGVVFAARQLAPRRPVAIKFLIRPTVEADMLARLKHPSIPLIHQCGTVYYSGTDHQCGTDHHSARADLRIVAGVRVVPYRYPECFQGCGGRGVRCCSGKGRNLDCCLFWRNVVDICVGRSIIDCEYDL